MRFRKEQRGNSLIEFTLVGIPIIFLLISIVDVSTGMWDYETLAYAVKQGARFAVVHGQDCSSGSNSCGTTVGAIANRIAYTATGLPAAQINATLTTQSGAATTCNPLSSCFTSTTAWPPATPSGNPDNAPGKTITVYASFTCRTVFNMFWPGHRDVDAGPYTLPAQSTQTIQF
jgi:Flp pilus assembly protein TadG